MWETFRTIAWFSFFLTPDLVRARLGERAARGDGLSDATWATYLRQSDEFEQVVETVPEAYLMLDTSADLSSYSRNAADWLRRNDF
ncbi:MAG: hypothetical protein L0226_14590 [Acidobacteria bacterium]|nr:hypothetical protein [Acidobacteriota bacterium]